MSYISAAAAKERIGNYFGNFDAFDNVSSGMKAASANRVADTKYGAQQDYFELMGETNLGGIAKVGSAQRAASNDAMTGNIFGTVGSLAQGVSSFGVEHWDWGKPG